MRGPKRVESVDGVRPFDVLFASRRESSVKSATQRFRTCAGRKERKTVNADLS